MRRFWALALFLLLIPAGDAHGKLVGEFDAAIRNVRPWGAYTVVASARVYDTTGVPAPRLASAIVHFPRGASLRGRFLRSRYFCDRAKLLADPDPARCGSAQFASGSLLLDARPAILEPVPASIWLFLAPGGERGSRAKIVALVAANQQSPAWNFDVLDGYLVKEPRSAARFGYRLELPTTLQPLLPQVTLSLIEMKLRIVGLAEKRPCARLRAALGRALHRPSNPHQAHVLAEGAGLPPWWRRRVRSGLRVSRRPDDREAQERELLPLPPSVHRGGGRDSGLGRPAPSRRKTTKTGQVGDRVRGRSECLSCVVRDAEQTRGPTRGHSGVMRIGTTGLGRMRDTYPD